MTRMKTIGTIALAALAFSACDNRRGMTVRTYELHRLTYREAETLITPYVSEGGFISGQNRLMTVRERPRQLDSIAAILRRYDGAPAMVSLHFQIIEAGNFAGGDSAIAQVVAPMREMFRYRGYRLVSELTLRAVEGGRFQQFQPGLRISGMVSEASASGGAAQVTLDLTVATDRGSVATSVSGAPGKTMLIGTQQQADSSGALIAAVTPEIVAGQP